MRKIAAKAFFLAVFALFSEANAQEDPFAKLEYSNTDVCALDPQSKVSDACASYADLDKLNHLIQPFVRRLANDSDFFSYYRLNLYNKECPFWSDENGLCGNIACAVTTVDDEKDLPKIWRAEELSKLEGPKASHPGKKQQAERKRPLLGELGEDVGESCVVEYDDECDERDYCIPEDASAKAKGDYVSLANNPERFTGYSGEGAHQVWQAIYNENCFSRPLINAAGSSSSGFGSSPFDLNENQAKAALDFKNVMRDRDRQQALESGDLIDALDFEDECVEKRMFHRVISGMHSSISTHLCYDYLNQTTGEWGPNLQCYKDRLHNYPERISNLYFNYALVLRAVGKLRDYVQDYPFCTGDPAQNQHTKNMIRALAYAVPSGPDIFDESVMFQDQTIDGISLKEDFRNRFRNVSRIMDCVGCDKCRLWGKIQTAGYGTAMKVLFEFDENHATDVAPLLRRTELVALINTLDKISSALKALEEFRDMIAAEESGNQTPASSTSMKPVASSVVEPDDFDDLDDSENDEEYHEPTLAEEFWSELDLVWSAYKFVLKSWFALPGTLFQIAKLEINRAFKFWVGQPVPPRAWKPKWPTRDDL
ncbi:endoplasmic reticulum Oxidoreductin 1-domain-containing protein [Acrodontium crateriforme]|uniref:Endoplasmic reticulum Oxidoreductin 1-domain-containing protein n=1 Tax=Acrodontium crateriforme TaxID=150365 RepID=A0AAQ3M906_9PEZI|nr:endoplasmic reticulum Oxidoreductin 1-domain-containing protein [Acrodontium crateriforme]